MASASDIRDGLKSLSSRISETTRTISLGVLAMVWLFLAGGGDKPALSAEPDRQLLILSGFFVLLSLLSDYLQYLCGYWHTRDVFTEAENSALKVAQYQPASFLYRARDAAFWLKQFCAIAALLALFLALRCAI